MEQEHAQDQEHVQDTADPGTRRAGLRSRDRALAPPRAELAGWKDADVRAVDTARLLAADAVEKAGNGHPGTAMSLAPLAYVRARGQRGSRRRIRHHR
jgi:Transketolase, thiamine diphosphate binding domain